MTVARKDTEAHCSAHAEEGKEKVGRGKKQVSHNPL